MNVKIVTPSLRSISAAAARCDERQIAGSVQYAVGKWVEAIPGSLGLFFFEVDDRYLNNFLGCWARYARAFECDVEGARPISVVINPGYTCVLQLSSEELTALKGQSPLLLSGARFHPAPRGVGYRTMAAQRIKLVRGIRRR